MSNFGGKALSDVATSDLEKLLGLLHRGRLECPVTHQALVFAGASHLIDKVTFLATLDSAATRAVLVAVIAERRATTRTRPREP